MVKMAVDDYAVAPGSRILVTGANSFIGSNIVDLLLELGFRVRGTVRTPKPWLDELFAQKYGPARFETVIVPSFESEAAFDQVLDDVAGIVHVASDVSKNPEPHVVIPAVVEATLNSLRAAARHPTVKRFVLTSSSTAALFPVPNKEMTVDEHTWNDVAVEAAYGRETVDVRPSFVVYAASKTQGERAAWQFADQEKPGFTLNTVLPNMTWGRILSPHIPGSTMGATRDILKGNDAIMKIFPPQWYVDVQDAARLHVIGLLDPHVRNERLFAFAGPYNYTDVVATLRKLRPHLADVIPPPPENDGRDLCVVKGSQRAEQLLRDFFGRPGWVSMEDSLAEGIVDVP